MDLYCYPYFLKIFMQHIQRRIQVIQESTVRPIQIFTPVFIIFNHTHFTFRKPKNPFNKQSVRICLFYLHFPFEENYFRGYHCPCSASGAVWNTFEGTKQVRLLRATNAVNVCPHSSSMSWAKYTHFLFLWMVYKMFSTLQSGYFIPNLFFFSLGFLFTEVIISSGIMDTAFTVSW